MSSSLHPSRSSRRRRSAAVLAAVVATLAALLAGPTLRATASAALDPNGAVGLDQEAALSSYGPGDPSVTIAYIEGGINWHGNNVPALASVGYVNWREAPVPCSGSTVATATMVVGGVTQKCHTVYSSHVSDYDATGTPHAADWAHDPRVGDANANSVIDPEDLVSSFCGAGYHPPETIQGFRCDIAGWDFYDNQNDPATIDSAYNHANDQMGVLHTECPACTIMPIKAGDEALDTTDNLARAWLFAAESGARVIVSVTADLGYSTFMRQVVDRVHAMGILTVEASNDFDTQDQQGGMFWPDVVPGNGSVSNATNTAFTRSDETSWGPHNMFTAATSGGSTSESTPTLGGVFALLAGYSDEAAAAGKIPAPLNGDQIIQLVRTTARHVTDPTLSWPGGGGSSDGWNAQYGYGIPDVNAAAALLFSGAPVSPTATITSPNWYQLYDPSAGNPQVTVSGNVVAARPTDSLRWTLEMAVGEQPTDQQWHVIGSGSATGSFHGQLGTLDLRQVPKSIWNAPMTLTTPQGRSKAVASADQYDVTLRLLATDTTEAGSGSTPPASSLGEDRRTVQAHHDSTLLPGFPLQIGASVEGQPTLADLQGTGREDLVFGDADGHIHAIDPANGKELPGWPAQTAPLVVVGPHPGIVPGDQPVLDQVAVGDLQRNGSLEVVVTSLDGETYVFDAKGQLEPGWPKTMADGIQSPPIPRPQEPNVRLPALGATAAPVLAPLDGMSAPLSIVQTAWNGEMYVWGPSGASRGGWPISVGLPTATAPDSGYTLEADHKLDTPPAVVYFDGPSKPPSLVVRSQETEILSEGIEPAPHAFAFAYSSSGTLRSGWPINILGLLEFYGSAQEFITEGSSAPIAADVDSSGRDQVAIDTAFSPSELFNGNGSYTGTYGNPLGIGASVLAIKADPSLAVNGTLPPGSPTAFTSTGAFGHLGPPGSPLSFAESAIDSSTFAGALLVDQSGLPIDQEMTAYPASPFGFAGTRPGFPAARQGLDFLGEPVMADVSGGSDVSIISGGDAGALMAFNSAGALDPGFPKFTGGWTLFSPSIGDLFGNGKADIVSSNRSGELFAWSTPGNASANTQWWHGQHDEWNSGNAGLDTRPPGAPRDLSWSPGESPATFVAPGGDFYNGQVDHYALTLFPSGTVETVASHGPAGTRESIAIPAGTTGISLSAYDSAGNVSPPVQAGRS